MKKLIIVIVVLAAAAGVWFFFFRGSKSADAQAAAPQLGKVERGNLRISVAANGRVVSNLDVEIKCKASGEIVKLPYDISDAVKKNDLLMELDPIDEQRMLKQTQAELKASQAKLKISERTLTIAEKTLDTDASRAQEAIKSAQVRSDDCRTKADRAKSLLDEKLLSQEDYDTLEAAAKTASSDLATANVKLEELKTQRDALELKRQDVRLAETAVESDQISLDLAQQKLTDTKVLAPMDGVVTARPVQIGQIVSSGISNVGGGTTVMTLSDLSRIFVLASVDESDIGKLMADGNNEGLSSRPARGRRGPGSRPADGAKPTTEAAGHDPEDAVAPPAPPASASAPATTRPVDRYRIGQRALITVDAYRGKTFEGKVVRITPRGQTVSNVTTYEVKIEVLGPDKILLLPEMSATVEIITSEKENVLLAPADSVIRNREGNYVSAVVSASGAVEEKTVQAGLTDGTKTEILAGLSEGDIVQIRRAERASAQQRQMNPGRMMTGGGPRGGGR